MLAAFGVALALISAIANVAAGVFVLVSWLRSEPIDPKEEERALYRSCSWPTDGTVT